MGTDGGVRGGLNMRLFLLATSLVVAVSSLKMQPIADQRLDLINAMQASSGAAVHIKSKQEDGNDTVAVAFDPLSPAEIVSLNMEVSGRIYQSCNSMSDSSARWTERMNARSEPNYHSTWCSCLKGHGFKRKGHVKMRVGTL